MSVVRIPLVNKAGEVVEHAQVNSSDAVHVMAYRWHRNTHGYAVATVDGVPAVRMHRLLMGLQRHDGRLVDHRNGDTLDNRRENLRLATHLQNSHNRKKQARSRSKYRGVSREVKRGRVRWRARAMVAGQDYSLGCFDSEDEAGRVVAEFRRQHMPFSEADQVAA